MMFQSPTKTMQSSDEVLEVLSPILQAYKRRKGSLGGAVRIKAPLSSAVIDKENVSNSHPSGEASLSNKTPTKSSNKPIASVLPEKAEINEASEGERPWHIDDFSLGKPLGRGKFGNVYFARQKATNVPIALKVLFKAQMQSALTVKMLQREVEIQYRCQHDHINRLYGYFHDTKNVYIMLEYAESGEFYKFLSKNNCQISESSCVKYILHIAKALQYLHQRHVYHRDVKPENILMGSNGKLMLADFGSAVHAPPPEHNIRYTVCGTPEYLAPEMIVGIGHDASLDMWSLGIMMYEVLFGRTPFTATAEESAIMEKSMEMEEFENYTRKKMYEKILSYKDDLQFVQRRSSPSSSAGIPAEEAGSVWTAPSEEAKTIMKQLICANKANRATAVELLQNSWFARNSLLAEETSGANTAMASI